MKLAWLGPVTVTKSQGFSSTWCVSFSFILPHICLNTRAATLVELLFFFGEVNLCYCVFCSFNNAPYVFVSFTALICWLVACSYISFSCWYIFLFFYIPESEFHLRLVSGGRGLSAQQTSNMSQYSELSFLHEKCHYINLYNQQQTSKNDERHRSL